MKNFRLQESFANPVVLPKMIHRLVRWLFEALSGRILASLEVGAQCRTERGVLGDCKVNLP